MRWDRDGEKCTYGVQCLLDIENRQCGWMPELREGKDPITRAVVYEIHDVVQGDGSKRLDDGGTWCVARFNSRVEAQIWALGFYAKHPNACKPELVGTGSGNKYVEPAVPLNPNQQKLLLLT